MQASNEDKGAVSFGNSIKSSMGTGNDSRHEDHPKIHNPRKSFPGHNNWNNSRPIVSAVPSWKRQTEMMEFSRRLGYRGDHILKEAAWMRSINGPGWQDVPPYRSKKSVIFPKAHRFLAEKLKASAVPGPGTYGKNHVPYATIEEKSHAKGFSFSIIPPFERSGSVTRSLSVQRSYHLPPNLYKIKTPIDEFVSKRVSKRGPYDLFSVERFPDPVTYKVSPLPLWVNPSDWNHPKNAFKGKFQRGGKDCRIPSRLILTDLALAPKNPLDPGPSDYNPYLQPVVPPARAPFNSSVKEPRPVAKCGLSPPPGRYSVDLKRKISGDGMKSAFLSKTKRGLPEPEKLSWFQ